VWCWPESHSIVGQVTELPDYREQFANRVRSLRETANLSIERASEQGGLSTNFWGSVERMAQEPCLNTIFAFAKGLAISGRVLMTFEQQDEHDQQRRELNNFLDLFSPQQLRLALDISRLIYEYKPVGLPTLSDPTPH
jgi:transcriptional regulator with XRE-family HTH domain